MGRKNSCASISSLYTNVSGAYWNDGGALPLCSNDPPSNPSNDPPSNDPPLNDPPRARRPDDVHRLVHGPVRARPVIGGSLASGVDARVEMFQSLMHRARVFPHAMYRQLQLGVVVAWKPSCNKPSRGLESFLVVNPRSLTGSRNSSRNGAKTSSLRCNAAYTNSGHLLADLTSALAIAADDERRYGGRRAGPTA